MKSRYAWGLTGIPILRRRRIRILLPASREGVPVRWSRRDAAASSVLTTILNPTSVDDTMSSFPRLLPVLTVTAFAVILAGCPGDYAGGYDKVPARERTSVALAAAPNPPPVIAGFGGPAAETPVLSPDITPPGVTQAMVENGQQLYGTVCTACHGPAGAGSPAGPALQDQSWIHIGGAYDEIVAIIQSGVATPQQYPAAMPPLGGGNFDANQVRDIAAYIFALSRQPGP